MPEFVYSDVVLTWTGAAGVVAYIQYILTQRTRSFLEQRTLFLLYCLALLLFLRGIFWLSDSAFLAIVVFIPATLLPLAIALFVEGLLRRHLRFAFKVYVSAGTLLFLALDLLTVLTRSLEVMAVFGVFVLSVLAYLGVALCRRNPLDLSETENRFTNAVAVASVVGLPLALTDFSVAMWSWAPLKLGSLGGLIFVYACVRMSSRLDRKRIVFGELIVMLAMSALVAAGFLVASGGDRAAVPAYLAVAASFILLFTITERLHSLRHQSQEWSLLRTLLAADNSGPDRFIASLRKLPFMEEQLMLRAGDLTQYDTDAIVSRLEASDGVCRLTGLREHLAKSQCDQIEAREQMVDMLERYHMSHVCLIQRKPVMLLLVNLPQVAGGQLTELELGLVRKFAGLMDSRS